MGQEHHCVHEVDLSVMAQNIKVLCTGQRKIVRLLEGNGKEGLVIQAALNKQGLKRAWWWLGGVSIALLGGVVALFFKG